MDRGDTDLRVCGCVCVLLLHTTLIEFDVSRGKITMFLKVITTQNLFIIVKVDVLVLG